MLLFKWSINFCDLNFHHFGSKFSIHFWRSWLPRKRSILYGWRSAIITETVKNPWSGARYLCLTPFIRLGKVPRGQEIIRSSCLNKFCFFVNVALISYIYFWNATLFFALFSFIQKFSIIWICVVNFQYLTFM